MKNFTLFLLMVICLFSVFCQVSPERVAEKFRNDKENYVCGDGFGSDLETADKQAMAFLIDQISTNISSNFEALWDQETMNNELVFNEKVKSVVRSYSCASLDNVEQILLQNDAESGQFHVFRYVAREEIEKSFDERKDKILDFIEQGERQEEKTQLNLALKYYSWSLLLLRSNPKGDQISFKDSSGKSHKAYIWLPNKISEILSNIEVVVTDTVSDGLRANLNFLYKGKLLPNKLDYCYWNGFRNTKLYEAKDGFGTVFFEGMMPKKDFHLYIEAGYEKEAKVFDIELKMVSEAMGEQPFKEKNKLVSINPKEKADEMPNFDLKPETMADNHSKSLENKSDYLIVMQQVEDAIRAKDYNMAKDLFTENGFNMFRALFNYGTATIIRQPQYEFLLFGETVLCRSITLQFNCKSNANKNFVENVAFRFNPDIKIESVAFTLTKQTENELLADDKQWDELSKLVLINFLEDYQTAYALKRFDFLESIFSDSALIIVGTDLQNTTLPKDLEGFIKEDNVIYKKRSKEEYMTALQRNFKANNYINLRFEDIEMTKKQGHETYGVQVRQNYYSSTYNDIGYLTLLVDLSYDLPVIHVRVWNKDKNELLSSKTILTKPYGFEKGEW